MLCGMWRSLRGEMWNQTAPELQDKIPLSCHPSCVFFTKVSSEIFGRAMNPAASVDGLRLSHLVHISSLTMFHPHLISDIILEDAGWVVYT